jgi:hypothetical protein
MAKTKCPKCKGKGCSHCNYTGYHNNNMNKGGMMNEGMKALKKEAPEVAKKMGYNYGGMAKKKMGMMGGGMAKKRMGYGHGGLACGASNPAERPLKKKKSS